MIENVYLHAYVRRQVTDMQFYSPRASRQQDDLINSTFRTHFDIQDKRDRSCHEDPYISSRYRWRAISHAINIHFNWAHNQKKGLRSH